MNVKTPFSGSDDTSHKASPSVSDRVAAVENWQKAVTEFSERKDRLNELKARCQLAFAYLDSGEVQAALAELVEADDRLQACYDERIEADLLTGFGCAYAALGESLRARAFLNRSLKLWLKLDQAVELAWVQYRLAELSLSEAQSAEPAEPMLSQTLLHAQEALSHAAGDKPLQARLLGLLARLYRQSGEHEQALTRCLDRLALVRELADQRTELECLFDCAELYRLRAEPAQALRSAEDALNLAMQLQDKKQQARAELEVSLAFEALQQPWPALKHYKQHHQLAIASAACADQKERCLGEA